jgi:medium-chain acyl-[acyl-carrier-protein] hydrolase
MDMHQFEKEYIIHVYETGPDGRLNIFSMFNFMQDIASEHAIKLGFGRDDLLKKNNFWVLSRMYVEIREWPVWEEKIIVRTWPNGTDKLFAMRNYKVEYPNGKHIASGTSSWLIVDLTTKRIQRPGELLSQFSSVFQSDKSPVRSAEKLQDRFAGKESSAKFRVQVSDLDINLHTNNANYLKWIYNTYDLNFVINHHPCSVEINYLAESKFEDEIVIFSSTGGDNINDHMILRTSDNKELCRIRIGWEKHSSTKV